MDTSLALPSTVVPNSSNQPLTWPFEKKKEEKLTSATVEALNTRFKGVGVTVAIETDEVKRLTHDLVIALPNGARVTVECKYEDYAETWFPEVAQLIVGPEGRRSELGWVYKTTAHLMLYVSTTTGAATFVARERVLNIQVALLQACLLESADYKVPIMLNAELNGANSSGPLVLTRAGVGLGLLIRNVLTGYRAKYGRNGLIHMNIRKELLSLKTSLLSERSDLGDWAMDKLLADPFEMQGAPASAEGLVEGLTECVNLSTEPIPRAGFLFFERAMMVQTVSGQSSLLRLVSGNYETVKGLTYRMPNPLPSSVLPSFNGREIGARELQKQWNTNVSELLAVKSKDYLQDRRYQYLQNLGRQAERT